MVTKCDGKWFLVTLSTNLWPKMAGQPFLTQICPMVVILKKLYWFEMARNALKSDIGQSKMVSSDNFWKNCHLWIRRMSFRNVGSLSNNILVNFSCLYVNWGQNKDQSCLPEGQVSNFAISAFRSITKYDFIEAKRLLHLLINESWNLALCYRGKPLKYLALGHGFASGLCGLTPFHFLDQDQECFWKTPVISFKKVKRTASYCYWVIIFRHTQFTLTVCLWS